MLGSLTLYLSFQRQAGELDESVLELTSQILGANPDFATLWNCRREVLQQLEAQKCVLVQCPRKTTFALPLTLPGTEVKEEWSSQGHRDRMVGSGFSPCCLS